MSNIDPEEICANCKHFVKEEGHCRKYAPRGGEGRPWPSVEKKHWCSEFEWDHPEGDKGKAFVG